MKERRYKSVTPVTDFSITQKIRTQLIEDGHTALVVEQITKPIGELEEAHALLVNRVVALEQERVKWLTESGVFRAMDRRSNTKIQNTAVTVGRKILQFLGALALLAAGAYLNRLIEKPH